MDLTLKNFLLSELTLTENISVSYLTLSIIILIIIFLLIRIKKAMREHKQNDASLPPISGSHLDLVSHCSYRTKKIMSDPEHKLFVTLKRIIASEYHVFPQVALGEVLASDQGHPAINAKRVDLLIVDSGGHAVAAVEFKGTGKHGHYQKDAMDRDTVKYIALKKAGVKYIAVSTTEESYIRRELENAGLAMKTVQADFHL